MFYSTTGEASGINRLELSFEDALLVCEEGQLKVCELGFSEAEYRKKETEHFPKINGAWKAIQCDGINLEHAGILQNFVNVVLNKEKLIAAGQEGIKSLLISNAIYLSSWQEKMIGIPQNQEEEEDFEKVFEEEAVKKGMSEI